MLASFGDSTWRGIPLGMQKSGQSSPSRKNWLTYFTGSWAGTREGQRLEVANWGGVLPWVPWVLWFYEVGMVSFWALHQDLLATSSSRAPEALTPPN